MSLYSRWAIYYQAYGCHERNFELAIASLFGPRLGVDFEVLYGYQNSFYLTKLGRHAETEEHDEEQDGPHGRDGHLGDGLCEHDEG